MINQAVFDKTVGNDALRNAITQIGLAHEMQHEAGFGRTGAEEMALAFQDAAAFMSMTKDNPALRGEMRAMLADIATPTSAFNMALHALMSNVHLSTGDIGIKAEMVAGVARLNLTGVANLDVFNAIAHTMAMLNMTVTAQVQIADIASSVVLRSDIREGIATTLVTGMVTAQGQTINLTEGIDVSTAQQLTSEKANLQAMSAIAERAAVMNTAENFNVVAQAFAELGRGITAETAQGTLFRSSVVDKVATVSAIAQRTDAGQVVALSEAMTMEFRADGTLTDASQASVDALISAAKATKDIVRDARSFNAVASNFAKEGLSIQIENINGLSFQSVAEKNALIGILMTPGMIGQVAAISLELKDGMLTEKSLAQATEMVSKLLRVEVEAVIEVEVGMAEKVMEAFRTALFRSTTGFTILKTMLGVATAMNKAAGVLAGAVDSVKDVTGSRTATIDLSKITDAAQRAQLQSLLDVEGVDITTSPANVMDVIVALRTGKTASTLYGIDKAMFTLDGVMVQKTADDGVLQLSFDRGLVDKGVYDHFRNGLLELNENISGILAQAITQLTEGTAQERMAAAKALVDTLGMILAEWARYAETGFKFGDDTAKLVQAAINAVIDSGNLVALMSTMEGHVASSERDRVSSEVMKLAGVSPDVARYIARERAKVLRDLVKEAVGRATPEMPAHVVLGTLAPEIMLGAGTAVDMAAGEAALRANRDALELTQAAGEAIYYDEEMLQDTDVVHMQAVDAGLLATTKDQEKLARIAQLYERLNAHKGSKFKLAVVGDVSGDIAKFLADNNISHLRASEVKDSPRQAINSALNPRGLQSTLTAVMKMEGNEAYIDAFAREVDSLILVDSMNLFGAATASYIRHRVTGKQPLSCTGFTDAAKDRLQELRRNSNRREGMNNFDVKIEKTEAREDMDDYILSDMEADVAF
jgi:hypothetical protein